MATQETGEERESQGVACCCIRKDLPVHRPVEIPKSSQEKAERLCAYNEPIVDSKVFMQVIEKVKEECKEHEQPQNERAESGEGREEPATS